MCITLKFSVPPPVGVVTNYNEFIKTHPIFSNLDAVKEAACLPPVIFLSLDHSVDTNQRRKRLFQGRML